MEEYHELSFIHERGLRKRDINQRENRMVVSGRKGLLEAGSGFRK